MEVLNLLWKSWTISIDTAASKAGLCFREMFALNMRAAFKKALLKERKNELKNFREYFS